MFRKSADYRNHVCFSFRCRKQRFLTAESSTWPSDMKLKTQNKLLSEKVKDLSHTEVIRSVRICHLSYRTDRRSYSFWWKTQFLHQKNEEWQKGKFLKRHVLILDREDRWEGERRRLCQMRENDFKHRNKVQSSAPLSLIPRQFHQHHYIMQLK